MNAPPPESGAQPSASDPSLTLLQETYGGQGAPPLFDPFALRIPEEFAAIEELRLWVAALVGRFGLAEQVPRCWESHWAIAAELAATFVAWLHVAEDTDGFAQLSFYERLAGALSRIERFDHAGCAARGVHSDLPAPTWAQEVDAPSDDTRADVTPCDETQGAMT